MAEASNNPAAPTAELPKTKEKVEELSRAAALQYKLKNFTAAADHYADAVEIQAELNGEMAPENAELLFYYGRALYKVAIAKSDVLGNKVAQDDKKKPKSGKKAKKDTEGSAETTADTTNGKAKGATPYFQLTGDENFTDSEDDEDADGEGGEEEDQDDFGNAYEVFEMARVLYTRHLEALGTSDSADKGKGKAQLSPQERATKDKIADCHGFLVEISLENERFHDAVSDARASLALQEELNPFEHENVTEGHYSLSLALEFASVSKVREEQTGKQGEDSNKEPEAQEDSIDYELRKEAAKHTEFAIQSLEARLKKEKSALTSTALTEEQKKEKKAIIKDKSEILEDMKTRLVDLQADPAKQDYDSIDQSVFQGLLGGLLGADAATQKAKLAEAAGSANDISGLVKTRKKEKAPVEGSSASNEAGTSKRKLEVEESDSNGKRAKTEEMQ
ncbi:hypothetical protein BDV95DRAFT_624612 [Massariosphaeria phaeospora]|uniref:Tetratricopeptide SHNi-TPR domain-containing protein n=1 Tax=Massariosphaeria phaeospora TaxID=100035 RepID=A0A7C8IF14_9PLEO|nr:hypothetical protein BDV95DRAFT_624612 [Massariosphaeria phaeospora]